MCVHGMTLACMLSGAWGVVIPAVCVLPCVFIRVMVQGSTHVYQAFLAVCRSHNLIRESEKHYKEIAEVLKVRVVYPPSLPSFRCFTLPCPPSPPSLRQNDQRYLVLDCVSAERELILQDYIHDLYQKGPPPPPTATNPTERLRKP